MTIHNIHLDSATKQALEQLIAVAQTDTGQGKVCANFLLAWHNPDENGGFALTELWALDDELAQACVVVARWLGQYAIYPSELGYSEALHAIWQRWR